MNVRDLLKRLIDWFLGQSKQKTETLILEEHTAPGIRLIRLQRRTKRAIGTWKALFYADRFDLDIGLDTLEYIEGLPLIERKNKLSTHAVNVVRVWYDTILDIDTGRRKIRRKILLSEECCLKQAYHTRDYSTVILQEFSKLLLKPQYHPDRTNLKEVFEAVARVYLGESHCVYLEPTKVKDSDGWIG